MALDCLIDYVGIKGIGSIPDSGTYINTLPGISLESLDRIANTDEKTYAGVWDDIQQEAAKQFSIDFFGEVCKCFKIKQNCDYENLICINKQILLVPWRYLLGVVTMQFRIYSDRINFFTTVTAEDAGKLQALYQTNYEKSLFKAVKLCDVTACQLHCGGNPDYVIWLP